MTLAVALAAALGAATALPAAAPPKPAAPPPGPQASVQRGPDGWRVDLVLGRPLLGWAFPRARDGRRTLFLLAGPPPEPKEKLQAAPCAPRNPAEDAERDTQLLRWRAESPDRLETVGTGLLQGALDAVDLDGDGDEDLILQHEGGIDTIALGAGGEATVASSTPDAALVVSYGGPRIAWDADAAGDGKLRVPLLGGFRTYGPGPNGGVALLSEIPVPQRVDAGPELFRVRSPFIEAIGHTPDGRFVFATEPEPLGKRRLRTLLLDPDGPAETRVVESWSLFPEPERMVDRDFALWRGSPVLIVTTTTADKLSLLGEKALRIYPLGGDRTRAGDPPLFAATTNINLWQQVRPTVIDLDADGREDLVLAYWKGLQNSIVAFEVYRGTEQGSFGKARSMSFDVKDGKRGILEFAADVDGDGRPDAVLRSGNDLLVFSGTPAKRAAEKPVETRPSRRVPLGEGIPDGGRTEFSVGAEGLAVSRRGGGLGTPHFVDVDGDGRPEIVFAGYAESGVGRATIVFVRGSP